MMSTTGAASSSRTRMRRGRHHDLPSSRGGQQGGGRSQLRCPISPTQRTSLRANSDQTLPRRHPHCRLLTRRANLRRFCRCHRIASGGRQCARMACTATPWQGWCRPSSASAEVGAQRRCVSQQRCAVQGGEQEQILCPIFFADQAALLGARLRWTTTAEGGRREEVESDVSALAKLGEAMTDTALAILMAGIAAPPAHTPPRARQ